MLHGLDQHGGGLQGSDLVELRQLARGASHLDGLVIHCQRGASRVAAIKP